jgi:hypothetical protein
MAKPAIGSLLRAPAGPIDLFGVVEEERRLLLAIP